MQVNFDEMKTLYRSLYVSLLRLQVRQCLVRDVDRSIKRGVALPSDINSAKNRLNS